MCRQYVKLFVENVNSLKVKSFKVLYKIQNRFVVFYVFLCDD